MNGTRLANTMTLPRERIRRLVEYTFFDASTTLRGRGYFYFMRFRPGDNTVLRAYQTTAFRQPDRVCATAEFERFVRAVRNTPGRFPAGGRSDRSSPLDPDGRRLLCSEGWL